MDAVAVCLCVSGKAAAFQTMEFHLKRTLCPKAIKTGRRSIGESLALQLETEDDYTSLLYVIYLFPPVSVCILRILSFHFHMHTHKHLPYPSLSSLPLSLFFLVLLSGYVPTEASKLGYLDAYQPTWYYLYPQS